jgi:cytochrome oxidase Cu insertion factor (SCO1/SenC/PrrC family)
MADKLTASRDKATIEEPKTTRLGLWVGLAAILITVFVAYWGVSVRNANTSGDAGDSSSAAPKTSSVSIGGPFALTDHNGKAVTQQNFRGKYMLVMFGYTFCPDVCPMQLTVASEAIDALGDDGKKVTPVFITIDPERDTVEHLKEYVSYFHPSLVALTGTADQIKSAAKAYRVYYAKANENKDDPEDYLMDHSAITYLMGPDGNFITHFSHGVDAAVMSKKIFENL